MAAALPFEGVGKPFLREGPAYERDTVVAEALDGVLGRAIFALPDGAEWFSGHVALFESARQFQVIASPAAGCADGCDCSPDDGSRRFRLVFKEARRQRLAHAVVDATGGDYIQFDAADAAGCHFEPDKMVAGEREVDALLDAFFPRLAKRGADARANGEAFACVVVFGRLVCQQLLLFAPKGDNAPAPAKRKFSALVDSGPLIEGGDGGESEGGD